MSASPTHADSAPRTGVWLATPATANAGTLAWLAALTFPAACPAELSREDIAAFIAAELNPNRFSQWLAAENITVLVWGDYEGYAVVEYGIHPAGPVRWREQESAYLNKFYLHPSARGTNVASSLMSQVIENAEALQCAGIWLGVNTKNFRAQRFYEKNGFELAEHRQFHVGGQAYNDLVLARPILAPQPV